jgi:hypothetical protein
MRLAYVTAHYPPDFTSGATLQVERIARRAAELGHDVEVFSGAIGMGLADGERRTETVDGVVVHWIGTADRIEQATTATGTTRSQRRRRPSGSAGSDRIWSMSIRCRL